MYKLILATTAALLALTTATPLAERQDHPDQIALGQLSYSRGNQFIAWTPSKTTEQEACRTHATIQSVDSGRPSGPICGTPFSVGNLVNVSLACGTSPVTTTTRDVVAVLDASGVKIENCEFICTWEA
ncbi:hypothetical protein GJ744_003681 [Endocarpon pusillum]|uniref:Uncharacterized protein n=1 Tax=Endocarpon pusillum TaxID=364733 RepID=A0A8H7A6D9_9EURO|nr:hypothetical protein GJ744_003681 [Endocarpon pusillum]